jgi:oligopeptide transport system permease protein
MLPIARGALAATAVGLLMALLSWPLGWVEGTATVLGLCLVLGTAWLPEIAARVLAAVLLAGCVVVVFRPSLGWGAWGMACLVLGASFKTLPIRVMRRVCFMVPSLVLLIFVTTLLMYHAPGNPFAREKVASPQIEAALRAHYGIPESALEFFRIYMRRLLFEGSLGPSVKVQGRMVEELLQPALPVSMALGVLALTLATALGLLLGVRAGLKPRSLADHASMGLALIGISLPNFVIGASLMIVFALHLGWLPVAGWGGFRHLILPSVTLALPYAAYIARLARNGTIEVMQQDFIRTARAKGLPERVVVLKHALKGATLPVVSFLGPAAAGIMTGSFVVETLFGVPGMGQWFVKGAINRDYSVVLGTAIVYMALVTMFNLVVDLAYAWLDPRVRGDL